MNKKELNKLHKKCKETAIPKIEIDGRMVYVWFGRVGFADNFMYKKFLNNQKKERVQMKIDLEIARIAHEAVRDFCIEKKLPGQLEWDKMPDDMKNNAVNDVAAIKTKLDVPIGANFTEYKDADSKKMVAVFIKTVKAEMKK